MTYHQQADTIEIDVIIRLKQVDSLTKRTIDSIRRQKHIRPRFLVVDTDSYQNKEALRSEVDEIIQYTLPSFSYSMAINIAIPSLTNEFTLIVSSHTSILNDEALSYASRILLSEQDIAGACLSDPKQKRLGHRYICKTDFNGFNGLWNTCALYRSELLRIRPFNPDMKSAEDQEWSRWALFSQNMHIVHITGCATINNNPKRDSARKRLAEWRYIARLVSPHYLSIVFIVSRLPRAAIMLLTTRPKEAAFDLGLAFLLTVERLQLIRIDICQWLSTNQHKRLESRAHDR